MATAVLGRLLDLALPARCPGCGAEGPPICARCLPQLDVRATSPPGTPLGLWGGPPAPLLQLEWCAPFGGMVRRALHALKYGGEQRMAIPLGDAVARRWQRAGSGAEVLVHVPVHEGRRRERGYDQAALLAQSASRTLGLPWAPALVRDRATVAQYRLDREQRAANLAGAFRVDPRQRVAIAGRWILLVDDVVTTGASLAASAAALLAAGAAAVSAVTVARER